MTSKQEAKISMYDAVIQHCNANPAIIATVPAFSTALTSLATIYSTIISTAQLEMSSISGVTMDKAQLRENLENQAFTISSAVYAWAASNDDNELKEQMRYPISKLQGLKDELIGAACLGIYNAANDNVASLTTYGITAPVLTAFQTLLNDWGDAIQSPRNAVSQRVAYSESIRQLIKDADEILKDQLDKIAPQFKATEPEFYTAYKNNRIILDAPTSTTKIIGGVVQYTTDVAVPGVAVQVVGKSYAAVTDNSGSFEIAIPVPGIYSLTFTKEGFETVTKNNVEVALGQTTVVNIELPELVENE